MARYRRRSMLWMREWARATPRPITEAFDSVSIGHSNVFYVSKLFKEECGCALKASGTLSKQ